MDGEKATSAASAHATAGSTSGPAISLTWRPPSSADAGFERRCRLAVVDGDPGARIGQEADQPHARPREPEHRHGQAAQGSVTDRIKRQSVEIEAGHRHASRWSSARKSVTPSRPASPPTIQKRSVIFVSGQPPSSKW